MREKKCENKHNLAVRSHYVRYDPSSGCKRVIQPRFAANICMIRQISTSLSLGSDSATRRANAARPTSLTTSVQSSRIKRPFLFKKSRKSNAALRLLPSENG